MMRQAEVTNWSILTVNADRRYYPAPSIHVLVTVDLILFPIVFGWDDWIDRLRQPNETFAHV
jgi:hypothetical protein